MEILGAHSRIGNAITPPEDWELVIELYVEWDGLPQTWIERVPKDLEDYFTLNGVDMNRPIKGSTRGHWVRLTMNDQWFHHQYPNTDPVELVEQALTIIANAHRA